MGTTTDSTGTAVIDNLTPGSYQVEVTDGTDAATLETVDVVAGSNTSAVALASAGSLTGTVTDSSDTPVSGATVAALGSTSGLTFIATTGASGTYSLSGLPADTYTLVVRASGDAPTDVDGVSVGAGTQTTADATLPTTGSTLDVLLAASGSGPLPALNLTLEDPSGAPVAFETLGAAVATTDATARATFTPLTPGAYTLVVAGPGRTTTTEPVTVAGGTTSVTVDPPPGEAIPPATASSSNASSPSIAMVVPSGELLPLLSSHAEAATPGYWESVKYFFQSWSKLIPDPSASNVPGHSTPPQTLLDTWGTSILDTKYTCDNPFGSKARAYYLAALQALARWQGDYNYLQDQSSEERLNIALAVSSAIGAIAELVAATLAVGTAATAAGATGFALGAEVTAAIVALSTAQIVSQAIMGFGTLTPNGIVGQINNAVGVISTPFDKFLKAGTKLQHYGELAGKITNWLNVATSSFNIVEAAVKATQNISANVHDGNTAEANFYALMNIAISDSHSAYSYECPPKPQKPKPPPVVKPIFPYHLPQNADPHDPNQIIGPAGARYRGAVRGTGCRAPLHRPVPERRLDTRHRGPGHGEGAPWYRSLLGQIDRVRVRVDIGPPVLGVVVLPDAYRSRPGQR